jgi:hypothetical protein
MTFLHGAQHHSFRCVRKCSLDKQRRERPQTHATHLMLAGRPAGSGERWVKSKDALASSRTTRHLCARQTGVHSAPYQSRTGL